MIPIVPPRFGLDECNTEAERAFVEALHRRAEAGGWVPDAWVWDDRVVVAYSVCDHTPGHNLLLRTLRVDFDGAEVRFGPDETQQFATELHPGRAGVTVRSGRPIAELADAAAHWLEREMRRSIVRQEWDRPDGRGVAPRLWVLTETGEGLAAVGRRTPEHGAPDRVVPVSGLMAEAEWLACRDIFRLVRALPHLTPRSEERFRDMAHGWVDRVREHIPLDGSQLAVYFGVYDRWRQGRGDHPRDVFPHEEGEFDPFRPQRIDGPPILTVIEQLVWGSPLDAAMVASGIVTHGPTAFGRSLDAAVTEAVTTEFLAQFHDIAGNPYRPVAVNPAWRTSTVVALAEGIFRDSAFDRLPILADALQDAGCEDEAILGHCRGGGPHARGCWVIDGVLGKE